MEEKFEIEMKQLNEVLKYLSNKPYIEVFNLVNVLSKLPKVEVVEEINEE